MIGTMTKIITISHRNTIFFAEPFQYFKQQGRNII